MRTGHVLGMNPHEKLLHAAAASIRDLCAAARVENAHSFDAAILDEPASIGLLVSTTPGVGLAFIDLEDDLSHLLGEEVLLVARESPAADLIGERSVAL